MTEIAFVTGATGFIGSNVTRMLLKRGFEVHVLVREETKNLWRIDSIKEKLHIHHGDLINLGALENIFQEVHPNYIFHLATYGAYPRYENDIEKIITINSIGIKNLFEAAKKVKSNISMIVNTGSSSEYGIKDKPMKEGDFESPINVYGAAKLFCTKLCNVLSNEYKIPAITLRIFSAYGYYEDPRRFVPYVIKSAILNERMTLSNPNFVRDFIFIDDVCEAYMCASKFDGDIYGEVFNVGTGKETTLGEFLQKVIKYAGYNNKVVWTYPEKQDEPKHWLCDKTKSERILKFKANTSIDQGIQLTIQWMRENVNYYR
jgi:nucleoside-diphosphate-sugar epimerase